MIAARRPVSTTLSGRSVRTASFDLFVDLREKRRKDKKIRELSPHVASMRRHKCPEISRSITENVKRFDVGRDGVGRSQTEAATITDSRLMNMPLQAVSRPRVRFVATGRLRLAEGELLLVIWQRLSSTAPTWQYPRLYRRRSTMNPGSGGPVAQCVLS